ncbi:MAG: hypothetical protein ACYC0H_07660, partial [Solirubrobacteraceae bacterium]
MDAIIAAALIAVGIVVAAALYGRGHGSARSGDLGDAGAAATLQATLAERSAALQRREESIERREGELAAAREDLAERRGEIEQQLERLSGLSAARA